MRWGLVACVIGGCGRLAFDSRTDGGSSSDAQSEPRNCTQDDFGAGANTRWIAMADTSGFSASLASGEVQFTLAPNTNGYAWVEQPTQIDLTGAATSIEALAVVGATNAETYLIWYADSVDFYVFDFDYGKLRVSRRLAGIDLEMVFTYESVAHRFWKIQHVVATNQVTFSASADRMAWQPLFSVDATVPVTNMAVNIAAGEYSGGLASPGMPRFDNFELCLP